MRTSHDPAVTHSALEDAFRQAGANHEGVALRDLTVRRLRGTTREQAVAIFDGPLDVDAAVDVSEGLTDILTRGDLVGLRWGHRTMVDMTPGGFSVSVDLDA